MVCEPDCEDPLEKGKATQYTGLENSMGCIVHGVAKSQTWLSDFHFHFLLKTFSKLLKTSLLLPSLLPHPYCSGLLVSQCSPLSPALLMVSPMNLTYFRAFALTCWFCLSLPEALCGAYFLSSFRFCFKCQLNSLTSLTTTENSSLLDCPALCSSVVLITISHTPLVPIFPVGALGLWPETPDLLPCAVCMVLRAVLATECKLHTYLPHEWTKSRCKKPPIEKEIPSSDTAVMEKKGIWKRTLPLSSTKMSKDNIAGMLVTVADICWPKVCVRVLVGLCLITQSSPALCNHLDCSPPGSSVHGDSPGKNTGMGCYALLQGIFPTQGLNPGLLHCRQILYHLSHQGSPWILEWVVYPVSRESSWPRNWTGLSCITGRFFTSWASREARKCVQVVLRPQQFKEWNAHLPSNLRHQIQIDYGQCIKTNMWWSYDCHINNHNGLNSPIKVKSLLDWKPNSNKTLLIRQPYTIKEKFKNTVGKQIKHT